MIFALPFREILYIQIGPLKIFVWGLFFALAFFLASTWAGKLSEKYGFSQSFISTLTLYILCGAVVGGRLGYVVTNFSDYLHEPFAIFRVWEGGLAFYGGFLGSILAVLPFLKKTKMSFLATADFLAPFAMLGYAITRIGCFLVGDHLGKPTEVPWAIFYQGKLRHPVSFYHLLVGMVLFFFLYQKPHTKTGERFFLMLALYGLGRFFVEFFREEASLAGLHLAQWVSLGLVFVGLGAFQRAKQKRKGVRVKS